MISQDFSCKQLVAGNYDVIINEPAVSSSEKVLTSFLKHFERYENDLEQFQRQQIEEQLATCPDGTTAPTATTANGANASCGYINEFKLLKELSRTLKENKANLLEGELDQNQRKNRYKDIIPFSHTRVILNCNQDYGIAACSTSDTTKDGIDADSSYINANYVRGPSGSPRAYIACQGPLACTLNDFWRMIWECNVSVVVMACNESESGKPKCELYWPDQIDASQTYGNIQVTLMRVRQINSDFLIRKFSVKLLEPLKNGDHIYDCQATTLAQRATATDGNNNSKDNYDSDHDNNLGLNMRVPITNQTMANGSAHNCATTMTTSHDESNFCCQLNASNTTATKSHLIIRTNYCTSNGNSSTSNESINTSDDSSHSNNQQRLGYQQYQPPSQPRQPNNQFQQHSHPNPHPHPHHHHHLHHQQQQQQQAQYYQKSNRAVLSERTICQFHYTTWPDHGVPDSVQPILELVHLMREVQPAEDKPILIHCSAGCGRTGTICCIDYVWGLLRMGKLDSGFNLCNIISEMRQQRMAMVQTLEQYILCHRAVAALFMQQLHLLALDNGSRPPLSVTMSKQGDDKTSKMNTESPFEHIPSSIVGDPAIEDNGIDLDKSVGESDDELATEDEDLGPVFI